MIPMKSAKGLLLALALCAAPVAAANPVETKILTELDRFEPFEGHVFHAGNLWVGRSRKDMGSYYRLELFSADGAQLASKTLVHSIRYLYPYGPDAVLAVGMGLDQVSHYTIARLVGGSVQLEEHAIPESALADRFAGRPGAMVFSDPGGYDDGGGSPGNGPLSTLFTLTRGGNGTRYLAPRIAGPREGLMLGDKLYLVSSPTVFSGGVTLNKINVASETFTKVLDGRNGLTDLAHLPLLNLLAIAEGDAKQVVLFDLKTDRLAETLTIDAGRPRAVATIGSCLYVGTEDTKQIFVFDLKATDHSKPLATWDLSGAGDKFFQLRNLEADPESGRLYARSAYACSPVEANCGANGRNSVIMVTPAADDPAQLACVTRRK